MQTFTISEIDQMLEAIKLTGEYYKTHSGRCVGVESTRTTLRAMQLSIIAEKLLVFTSAGQFLLPKEYNKRARLKSVRP